MSRILVYLDVYRVYVWSSFIKSMCVCLCYTFCVWMHMTYTLRMNVYIIYSMCGCLCYKVYVWISTLFKCKCLCYKVCVNVYYSVYKV